MALDPADRAFCVGYSDGSIQLVDFYTHQSFAHAMYDSALQSMPTQPPNPDRWPAPNGPPSAALTIQYSYDGTILLSGHENGTIQTWDTARGQYGSQAIDLGGPVTNLKILPPTGFPIVETPLLKTHSVIKPRYESTMNGSGSNSNLSIPMDYTFTAQLLSPIPTSPPTSFDLALSSPLFPSSMISASLASFNNPPQPNSVAPATHPTKPNGNQTDLETQNKLLFTQLETALQNQRTAIKQVLQLERDRYERTKRDERKAARKRARRVWREKAAQFRREAVMNEGMAKEGAGVASLRSSRAVSRGAVVSHGDMQEVVNAQGEAEEHDDDDDERNLKDKSQAKGGASEKEREDRNPRSHQHHDDENQPQNQDETMEEDLSSTTDDFTDSD